MATITPSPSTWTLRLKSHKTTVLLHIDPLHTFTTIKSNLFAALQDTSLNHAETGDVIPLPASPSDIQLGRPVNINDPNAGFQLGEWEYTFDEEGGAPKSKTKGKGRASKNDDDALATAANINQCAKGAGLKDGAVLAFRWKGDGTGWEEGQQDMDEGVDVDMDIAGDRPSMWGVKIASFEDSYGVENEGDVGGRREFDE